MRAQRSIYRRFAAAILFLTFHATIIGQLPVANFTANNLSGCAPLTVQFTDISTGNPFSWNWDFGNGQLSTAQNPIVIYNQPGTYTVTLIVRNTDGLDEEIKTNYITVFPAPVAAFTADMTLSCVPATIQFSDQSTVPPGGGTIVSWEWNFGDGSPPATAQNPSHIFTATGYYSISLKVTSSTGCTSFKAIGRYIRVVSGIDADFNFSQPNTCQPPFLINFQDQSNGPGNLSYSWSFGNGGPGSTLANPSATYSATGTYAVQLNVQSDLGCSGTITKNIIITGKTTDFIAPASICVGQSITFQNNSSPPPQSSSWDFGDGTTSSQINPVKTFFVGGSYQVRLINDYGNCVDSITKTVTITTQPTINFTANDSTACEAPFTVQFTDTSPAASTWLWDFGDGVTSTAQNPSHTYTANGVYTVTLNITLPGGCSNTITKTQYIKIVPTTVSIANAPDGGCLPFTYSPIAVIQSVDSIISYSWNLGEPGAIYTTISPTHTYTSVGNYSISLTITTQTGCIKTITIPNGIRTGLSPTVNFSFTPNNVCASTPVQFTDLSTTSPGAFVEWFWDFGDSSDLSNLQNPQHVFQDTGLLNVKLVVANNGCRDSLELPIQILPPVAKFGYSVNCNNRLQITFLDSSLANPIYGPVTYEWRMGDPANTIIFGTTPPTFTYPAFGTYLATLIVTNGSCSYQTTREVKLLNEPAGFTINKNPVCKSEIFTLSATGNASNIFDYTWTIGGTVFADTTRTIDYSLATYGSYDVTLTVEDINGCFNTTTISNFITVNGPVASFSPTSPGGCINSPISFTDQSTPAGTITQWAWNFGDGNQQTYTAGPFSHSYSQTGIYSVSLVVKDIGNCTDTILVPNSVVITQPKAAFRADTFYCPLSPLQFIDTSSGSGLSHQWYFGDGGTSTLQNPTHAYPLGDATYNVKLVITDLVGCKDSTTKNQYINIRSPKAAFSMIDSTGVCIPLVTSFNFLGADFQSYYWDFGDGGSSSLSTPSHFYNAYGTYIPKLYVEGPGGCIDSAQSTVTIYDPAVEMQIAATPMVACDSLTANFTLTVPPGFRFAFLFGDGIIDSSQQLNLVHTYKSPGGYYTAIIVYDRFGCEAVKIGQPIIVNGSIPLFAKDKKEFCDQGEVFFTNYTLSYDPVISTVWDFGDGNSSTATSPSHIYTGPGTYVVKLTVTTQNQCTRSVYDTVRVYRTPSITITSKDTICINSPETFNAILQQPDTALVWQWTFGNGNSSQIQNPSMTYTSTGDFSIMAIATNKLGCADTATHDINIVPLPTAVPATDPIIIISGGSATLNMNYTGSITDYTWLPPQNLTCYNCPIPVASPQFTTKYAVKVEDRYGCTNTGEITVKVVCNGQNFFIPNTFSPNGDGSNDVFYPRGTGLFSAKTLRIFNRWGEIVFEKHDFPVNSAAAGWDGTWKGKKANSDVYIYQLEIYCQNGELIKYNGNIALIR